jgi:UDP-glucose 4-epimerase
VLVTGAGGFIGRHVCERLAAAGSEVWRTSRSLGDGERSVAADLADLEAARGVVARARPDVIVHLAGHVSGSQALEAVPAILSATVVGSVNLFVAAAEAGCPRVVVAGSMEEPIGLEPAPQSPYAAAKLAVTGFARLFRAVYGLPVTVLRVFMVYGPGQPDELKLVPYTILSLLRGEQPRVTSGVRPVDWIYVDDAVDAFVRAAQADVPDPEPIDVGSGRTTTVREIVERLAAIIDPEIEPLFGALEDRPLELSRSADLARAEATLGWRPTTSLDEGLRRTVNWYAGREATSVSPSS